MKPVAARLLDKDVCAVLTKLHPEKEGDLSSFTDNDIEGLWPDIPQARACLLKSDNGDYDIEGLFDDSDDE